MKIIKVIKYQPNIRPVPFDLIDFDTKFIKIDSTEEIVFIHEPLGNIHVGKTEIIDGYYVSTQNNYRVDFKSLEEALLQAMKMMIDAIFKYDLIN